MSEIKGQLLGIVLVVTIFGAVSTALVAAFNSATKDVTDAVENNTIKDPILPETEGINGSLNLKELLTF